MKQKDDADADAMRVDGDDEIAESDKSDHYIASSANEKGTALAVEVDEPMRDEDDRRDSYADDEEPATVQGSKEGSEDLLRKVVHNEEEAYKLYCDYGHQMGFSVRKGKQSYFTGTKRIRTKDYFCSKEGLKENEKLTEVNFNDPHTRTNCKAMVRFRVNEQGEWKVIRLVSDHNHQLARPEERHLLRSARSIIAGRGNSVESMLYTGYQPSVSLSLVAGGSGEIPPVNTMQESCDPAILPRMPAIEREDLQNVINYLRNRSLEDGMFYWDVQIDHGGRMTNFFWRDGRSRIDYDCFFDVVVFDSTYRVNKYNMICAPFVGFSHHWQNTMFGCAILIDETTSSFIWLFRSFLESMGGQQPKSIFTNNDLSMAKAIEEVLPGTRHRIANWHIQKSAMSRIGALNASRPFYKMFTNCMQECDSEEEFDETWSAMLQEFKMQDNKFLKKLHKLRHKWSTAYNKEYFDGGLDSDLQCDTMNNIFGGIADKSSSLASIIISVDKLIEEWREKELDEDHRCSQKPPACVIKHSDILNHAAKVYTQRIYKLFETYFLDGCGATKFKETQTGGTSYRFEITMQCRDPKVFIVNFDTSIMELTCSCNKFNTMGLLCAHALKAMIIKNVSRIPDKYIVKRWTKDAKRWVYRFLEDESSWHEGAENEIAYCNYVMRFAYDLILKSQGQGVSRKLFWENLECAEREVDNFLESRSIYEQPYTS